MTRDLSDCDTLPENEQEMPEPETEDFFDEVVQNSLQAKEEEFRKRN